MNENVTDLVIQAMEELQDGGLLAVDTHMALAAAGFDVEAFITENQ